MVSVGCNTRCRSPPNCESPIVMLPVGELRAHVLFAKYVVCILFGSTVCARAFRFWLFHNRMAEEEALGDVGTACGHSRGRPGLDQLLQRAGPRRIVVLVGTAPGGRWSAELQCRRTDCAEASSDLKALLDGTGLASTIWEQAVGESERRLEVVGMAIVETWRFVTDYPSLEQSGTFIRAARA